MELSLLHMVLTNQCNYRCKYCFVHKDNPVTMTSEEARSAIDWAAHLSKERVHINLFGGEPTLNWKVIEDVVPYAYSNYPERFEFGMVTNCSFSKDYISFLKDNKIGVLASYDGMMTQNAMRHPDSEHEVASRIIQMLEAGVKVNAAMTLVPGHTSFLYTNFVSIADLGVMNIAINPVITGYRHYDEEDWQNINRGYDQIIDLLYHDWMEYPEGGRIHCTLLENNLSGIVQKAVGKYTLPDNWGCGACRRALGVWPGGVIMPCHEMDPKQFPHWVIGTVRTGILRPQKIHEYTREDYRECDACEVTNCGHCRTRSFWACGDEEAQPEDNCRYQRLIYQKAILLFNRLAQADFPLWQIK